MPQASSLLDQFEVDVQPDNGAFVASVPKLGLQARGASAQAALDELQQKLGALREALAPTAAAGGVVYAAPPAEGGIRAFAIKTVIVVAAVIAGTFFLTLQLQQFADAAFYRIRTVVQPERFGGADFWLGVEKSLHGLADPSNDLPPEKKERLLRDIRTAVDRWRPFVAEIGAIFRPEEAADAAPDGAGGAPPAASGGG